jgi:dTMP kinase
MTLNKKGMFISFEGIDGCGKTTQIELLNKYLIEKGYETLITLEPGGSDIGKQLRQILLHHNGFVSDVCETLLYLADRAQHTEAVILKAVEENKIVLCDRFIDSTVAYHGYGRGRDIDRINLMNEIATQKNEPNLTFLFDAPIEIAQQRVGKEKDRLESAGLEFHKRVRDGYLELAKKFPNRIKLIDSSLTIEEVFAQVKKVIDEIL